MKILERIALILFSIIVLILAVISCLVVFQVISVSDVTGFVSENLENEIVARTVIGVSIVCIILAIKSLFFPSKPKKKEELKTGVLLENQDGRLLISRDTIENLINGVVHSFPDALETQTKVLLDADNNITVFVTLMVREEAIIKQLSSNIQNKIKETIKRNTDLDVKQVNINVKNVDNEKKQNEKRPNERKLNESRIIENKTIESKPIKKENTSPKANKDVNKEENKEINKEAVQSSSKEKKVQEENTKKENLENKTEVQASENNTENQ